MNDRDNIKYSSPLPYPEIKVIAKNQYYADILKEDYAGLVSELTAINQYIYNSFIFNSEDNQLSHLLENIAIVEMKHLEILAETIILLGGNPIYSSKDKAWNSNFVYYGNNLCNRLKANLDSEYKAINKYQQDINIINDPYIKAILKRIILDEAVHVSLFKEAINKYCSK